MPTLWSLPGGVTLTVDPQGVLEARDAAGATLAAVQEVDGRIRVTDSQGMELRVGDDLGGEFTFGDASIIFRPDGTSVWTTQAGDEVQVGSNGQPVANVGHDPLGYAWNDGWSPLRADQDGAGNLVLTRFNGATRTLADLRARFGGAQALPEHVSAQVLTGSSQPFPWATHLAPEQATLCLTHADGSRTLVSDGCTHTRFTLGGLRLTESASGARTWVLPDGTTVEQRADGSLVTWTTLDQFYQRLKDSQGRPLDYSLQADGSIDFVYQDGAVLHLDTRALTLTTFQTDGRWRVDESDGSWTLYEADGSLAEEQGVHTRAQADGSTLTRTAEGAWAWSFAPGTTAEGTAPTQQEDGTWTVGFLDGGRSTYAADGRLLSHLDGATNLLDEYDVNGRRTWTRSASGWALKHVSATERQLYLPDGTRVQLQDSPVGFFGTSTQAQRPRHADWLAVYTELDGSLRIVEDGRPPLWEIRLDGTLVRMDIQGQPLQVLHVSGTVDDHSDGGLLQQVRFSDGRVDRYQGDGSVSSYSVDGNLLGIRTSDGSQARLNADGTWTAVDLSGGQHHFNANGVLTTEIRADQTQANWAVDGSRTELGLDGTVSIFRPDGTCASRVDPNGSTTVFDLAGRPLTVTEAGGTVIKWTYRPDGMGVAESSAGSRELYRSDGSLLRRWGPDGSVVLFDNQGRWVSEVSSEGLVTMRTYQADGTSKAIRSDGREDWFDSSMRLVCRTEADGRVAEFPGDGLCRESVTFTNGLVVKDYLDGRREWLLPEGIRVELGVDGQLSATDSDGCPLAVVGESPGLFRFQHAGGAWTRVEADGILSGLGADQETIEWVLAPDGVRTSLLSGGRTRVDRPDGTWDLCDGNGEIVGLGFQDGSSLLQGVDGTVSRLGSDGAVIGITLEDGMAAAWDGFELWVAVGSDGTRHEFTTDGALFRLEEADGSVNVFRPDGTLLRSEVDGTVEYHRADGTRERRVEAGVTSHYDVDERLTLREYSDGTQEHFLGGHLDRVVESGGVITWYLIGGSIRREIDGTVSLWAPGGEEAVQQPDGTWTANEPDGTVHHWTAAGQPLDTVKSDGRRLVYGPDGSITTEELDGSSRTDFSDGTTLIRHPDGTAEQEFTDHSREVTDSGQTKLRLWEDGRSRLTFQDGTLVDVSSDGSLIATLSDGSRIERDAACRLWLRASGASEAQELSEEGVYALTLSSGEHLSWTGRGVFRVDRTDGRSTTWEFGGRTIEVLEDGTAVTTTATDVVRTERRDGTCEVRWPDGHSFERLSDGSTVVTLPDGSTLTRLMPFAAPIPRKAAGSGARATQDGGLALVDDQGTETTYRADGSAWVVGVDGTSTVWTPEGDVLVLRDGTQFVTEADGTIIETLADGSSSTFEPWGLQVQVDPEGRVTQLFRDGTVSREMADGTTYSLSADRRIHTTALSDGTVVRRESDGSLHVEVVEGGTLLQADGLGGYRARLADGTSLSWSSDGTVSMVAADGQEMALLADGSRVWRTLDGTLRTLRPDGLEVFEQADGSVSVRNAAGVAWSLAADGTVTTRSGAGWRVLRPDGSWMVWESDSTVREFLSDGTSRWWDPERNFHCQGADGWATTLASDGQAFTLTLPTGESVGLRSDGSFFFDEGEPFVENADGSVSASLPDGATVEVRTGELSWIRADGTHTTRRSDGWVREVSPDLSERIWHPNGDTEVVVAGTRTVWEAATLTVFEYQGDRLAQATLAGGTRITFHADGQVETETPTGIRTLNGRSTTMTMPVDINGTRELLPAPVMLTSPALAGRLLESSWGADPGSTEPGSPPASTRGMLAAPPQQWTEDFRNDVERARQNGDRVGVVVSTPGGPRLYSGNQIVSRQICTSSGAWTDHNVDGHWVSGIPVILDGDVQHVYTPMIPDEPDANGEAPVIEWVDFQPGWTESDQWLHRPIYSVQQQPVRKLDDEYGDPYWECYVNDDPTPIRSDLFAPEVLCATWSRLAPQPPGNPTKLVSPGRPRDVDQVPRPAPLPEDPQLDPSVVDGVLVTSNKTSQDMQTWDRIADYEWIAGLKFTEARQLGSGLVDGLYNGFRALWNNVVVGAFQSVQWTGQMAYQAQAFAQRLYESPYARDRAQRYFCDAVSQSPSLLLGAPVKIAEALVDSIVTSARYVDAAISEDVRRSMLEVGRDPDNADWAEWASLHFWRTTGYTVGYMVSMAAIAGGCRHRRWLPRRPATREEFLATPLS